MQTVAKYINHKHFILPFMLFLQVWAGLFVSILLVSMLVALIDNKFRGSGLGIAYYFAFLDLFSIFLMEGEELPNMVFAAPLRPSRIMHRPPSL